ncbi:MAG TPA: septum formation initiator family protein [Vicinamibacteria bacterium]|nr:septum formation initiator family protein [Vicinamibacteria bacterium]
MTAEVRGVREDRSGDVGLRRKAATLASIIALVALIVGALFGDRGLLHLIDQRHRAEALAREVEELEAENAHLATEITSLRSDPRAIERLAREELGFVRPGETLFLVRDPAPSAP